ncbi:MAG: NAD(P)/FAD-dependent oxidoreductase [Candidatus Thermoplasmatota archaeon]
MPLSYDVVVVGAGPAGSTAARYAALHGADVLVIEKRQEIGSPVRCGEGLSANWLEAHGISPDPKWVRNEVSGARVISPGGHVFKIGAEHAGDEVGLVIERDLFDRMLAEMAVRAGAELWVKTAALGILKDEGRVVGVRAERMGERFDVHAPLIIAADGYESQVARWAGIDTTLDPKDIMSCLQYRMVGIECDRRYCDFYLGNARAPGGYNWVFPKGGDMANVGIGVQLSRLRSPGETKGYLDRFVDANPSLKKGEVLEIVAGAVSVCAPIERTVGDGIMLVGDAARQIDPLTGGGVANACKAAKIAGEVAAQALEARDFSEGFLMRYDQGWRAALETKLYRSYLAKEKLQRLSDDALDKLVALLSEAKIEQISTLAILREVKKRYPEIVKEFEDFLA